MELAIVATEVWRNPRVHAEVLAKGRHGRIGKCDFGRNFSRPKFSNLAYFAVLHALKETSGKTFARASRGFAEEDLMSSLEGRYSMHHDYGLWGSMSLHCG